MFGNNPFDLRGRATQVTVQEDPEMAKAIARNNAAQQAKRDAANPAAAAKRKADQAAIAKRKPVRPADIGRHSSQGGGFIGRRNESTNESKYVIPEEIPANERTAFHGAAAAAAKAGKKSFNFGGKTHPVTMKKDTAQQIPTEALDQKDKSTLMKVAKKLKGASAAHAGQSKAIMKDIQDQKDMDPKDHVGKSKKNPGMFCVFDKDGKEVKLFKDKKDAEDYAMKNHDKLMEGLMKDLATNKTEPKPKSDAQVAADFKKRRKMAGKNKAEGGGKEGDVQMNPKMETGSKSESRIREALLSVLEKKHDDHYKSATEPEMMKDKLKGKGAQDMAAGAEKEISKGPDAHLDEPDMLKKDRAKMTSNVKKSAMRKTDNPKGDTKVVPSGTPMKDPAAMKSESYDKMSGLYAAYASMYKTEEVEEEQLDEYYGGGGMSGFQGAANRSFAGQPKGVNPHEHEAHAKAAFKSGMKSKTAIVKHVEKKT